MQSLVAEVAQALDTLERPLPRAAEILRRELDVDRVSISRIDPQAGTFEIVATAGARLLVQGTRLPVSLSSHFLAAAESRTFDVPHFAEERSFDLPIDEVVLASGFEGGCAIPLRRGPDVVGAVALSCLRTSDFAPALSALSSVAGMLTLRLGDAVQHTVPVVLICHSDALVAHGIGRLADDAAGAAVVVCQTLEEACLAASEHTPDIIVCDDHVDGEGTAGIVAALRAAGSGAPVLVVATHDTRENRREAAMAGAAGYLARAEAILGVPRALAMLRAGGTALPALDLDESDDVGRLTPREREVLAGLDEGLRMKQLAAELGVSEATVKTHAQNLFRKLGATSRAEVVREARRQGILDG
jgi:DNA-binding NarL/FixJ family response regulator